MTPNEMKTERDDCLLAADEAQQAMLKLMAQFKLDVDHLATLGERLQAAMEGAAEDGHLSTRGAFTVKLPALSLSLLVTAVAMSNNLVVAAHYDRLLKQGAQS
ncbi:MAG: hypothetical protein AAF842_09530 [Planctomycetota bacterium]